MLFSAPMVQAILSRQKTQTRRVVKAFIPDNARLESYKNKQGNTVYGYRRGTTLELSNIKCPYGQIGDRLWVRETFCIGVKDNGEDVKIYKASVDDETAKEFKGCWKPSIFMPRSASRILLEITNVRVERLRDISEQDAIAEGIGFDVVDQALFFKNYMSNSHFADDDFCNMDDPEAAKKSYFSLWESINGRESLESNPWVWVITFKVVEIKR